MGASADVAIKQQSHDGRLWRDGAMLLVTPQHSRTKVDAAGDELIRLLNMSPADIRNDTAKWTSAFEAALAVIGNWRLSHNWPLLSVRTTLNGRAASVSQHAIIAQRLKRLPAIVAKLTRFRNMKLSQMQDIGGCRAIMPTVSHVERLAKIYRQAHSARRKNQPELIETYDYIAKPKSDGYRGIHLVYKYWSRNPRYGKLGGLRLEMQLRSQVQHAWAAAVETVDIFTRQALKSGIGDDRWKRFFVLMGGALAIRENRPLVAEAPADKKALSDELRQLSSDLHVETVLQGWGKVVEQLPRKTSGLSAFLLVLDPDGKTLRIQAYEQQEIKQASEDYLKVEREILRDSRNQAVLVNVKSLKSLRSAYPNFYLDTTAFVEAMQEACAIA